MSEQTDSIQKRVNDLCNDYLIQGVKITARLILSDMPDIKSTSTIHKYLTAWKEATKQNQSTLYDHLGFSQEFTQSFAREITRFGVEAERRHESVSTDAIEQRDEAIKGLERAEYEREKQTEIADNQAIELAELKGEISALLKKNKSDVESEKKTSEATATELRSQLATLTDDNKKLIQSNEHMRTELAKAELRVETNKEYVSAVKVQIDTITEQNKALNNEVIKLSNKGAGQDAVLSGNEKLISVLKTQDEQYKSQIAELREQNIEFRAELKDEKNTKALLTEKLDTHTKTIQSYEEILKATNRERKPSQQ